jgi:protein involved in polysaccharide export with SLBB domain
MEVFEFRKTAVFCVLIGFAATVGAQNSAVTSNTGATSNPGNNTTINPGDNFRLRNTSPAKTFDLDNQHRIRPGDKLSFRVAEDREEAKSLVVTDSGEIELPSPFGRFTATGKTCKQLGQEIKVALERDYYKRATVHIGVDAMNAVRGKVYVSGQVAKPGPVNIPVDAPLKLSQAILLAGPPTQWAKLSGVKVVRQKGANGGAETILVDVDAILKKGRIEKDIVVEPDDFIIVPERGVLIGG